MRTFDDAHGSQLSIARRRRSLEAGELDGADREHVALSDRAALEAAEVRDQEGGARAEDDGHVDAAANREVTNRASGWFDAKPRPIVERLSRLAVGGDANDAARDDVEGAERDLDGRG